MLVCTTMTFQVQERGLFVASSQFDFLDGSVMPKEEVNCFL